MRRRAVIGLVGFGVLLLVGLLPATASADQLGEGLRHLRQARAALDRAWDDKGGHKKTAIKRLDEAVDQVQAEMREPGHSIRDHGREGGRLEKRDGSPRKDAHHGSSDAHHGNSDTHHGNSDVRHDNSDAHHDNSNEHHDNRRRFDDDQQHDNRRQD